MKQRTAITVFVALFLIPAICLADSISFNQAADSHIVYASGILHNDDNYGSSTQIETANNGIWDTFGLIKFEDIFGSQFDQISADTTIISAELHLWMLRESDYFPNIINIYQLTKDWQEDTVTERNYGSVIANSTGTIIDSYSKPSDNNSTLPQELIFNVTSSLLNWQSASGSTNFGWGVESQKLSAVNWFYSSEYSVSDYHPFLVVNYDASPVPEPATILLLGSGIAGLLGTIKRRKK